MTKNEFLKLLILLARYVEIYHESTSDHNMNALSDAYSAVQNKLLGCVDRTMTPVELFDIVDAQCKVMQEGADEYIERLEAKLYDIVGSKRDFDEMLKTVKEGR